MYSTKSFSSRRVRQFSCGLCKSSKSSRNVSYFRRLACLKEKGTLENREASSAENAERDGDEGVARLQTRMRVVPDACSDVF